MLSPAAKFAGSVCPLLRFYLPETLLKASNRLAERHTAPSSHFLVWTRWWRWEMNKRLRSSSSLYSALLSLHQLRTLFSKMWHRVMCFAAWIGLRMSVKQSQGLHMTFAQCWAHWLTFRQMYSEWKSTPRCWHLANVEYDRKDERHYNHCFLQASTAKGISSCHWINGTLCFLSHTSIHLFIFFSCRDRDIQSF